MAQIVNIQKVDENLGLVFGFAMVCNIDGQPYFDLHGDHIPEHVMLKASTAFMQNLRQAKDMHCGPRIGDIVFAWPLTTDIAAAFGLSAEKTGLMVAMKPDNTEILARFKSGEYTGFSIGGYAKSRPAA